MSKKPRKKKITKAERRKIREYIRRVKNVPCVDCSKKFPPYLLTFDHLDSSTKLGNISNEVYYRNWNMKQVKDEIKKCEIVCAKCHLAREKERRNAD